MDNHVYRLGVCVFCGSYIYSFLSKPQDKIRFLHSDLVSCPICANYKVEMIIKKEK